MTRRALRSHAVRSLCLLSSVAVGAGLLSGCSSGSPYTIQAVLQSAEGLFPGNAVEVLDVPEGTVTSVKAVGDHVLVTMSVDSGVALPSGVDAELTSPQLLGEPSIELFPAYTGGPRLAAGSLIPESRTSIPVSIDQLLRDLQTYLGEVNPQAVGGVITNLAQDLQGQGQSLNQLVSQAAQTLNLLAQKGNELGQLNGSLAQVTGTLSERTSTVTELIQDYDQVASVIAQNSGPLGNAIDQLADASEQLSQLVNPNLAPLQSDIGTITQLGRTLDRNLSSLDQGLASTVSLFAGAGRAYDPVDNWLNLNVPLAPGLTASVVAGLVRDRLAGICRRVLAHHSSGLSATSIPTLESCGNPDSGYFDQLLSVLPNVLNDLVPGSTANAIPPSSTQSTDSTQSSPSAQSLISEGLSEIPGLSPSQVQQLSDIPASSLSGSSGSGSSGGSQSTTSSSPLDPSAPKSASFSGGGGALGGLLHGLLGISHFFGSLL